MSSVGKRDSFGKFLNACTASDQLGTLLEEEEDVEEEEEEDEGEKGEEEEEECDEDEEAQRADETFRAADETQMEGKNVEEPEDDDDDEILLEMNRQLNEKPLPHVPSHRQPGLSSCFSPAASPLSALVSTPTATSMSTPASIPTSVTTTMTPTPMQPPIFNSASTTDGISATTVPMAPPTTTIPIVDSLSPFVSSSPISSTTPTPAPAPTSTTTATITSSRPRPANLNLNTGLRPLSLTPDSLPLNTRAASISPLTSSNMNDTSMSAPVSGVTGSASSRVPGLRPLSLVAAVSLSSPSGLAPSQPSVTRRMSLISSSNNMSGSSSSNSSVSYRRSSMSLESDTLPPPPPASSNESSSRPGPLYQYATTLRRTSQSHLPTPGATPTSAVSPLHSGLPFGMSMMREEEECGDEDDDDEDETINNSDELCVEKDGDGQPQGSDGDASTPTGPASTTTATTGASPGKSGLLHSPTLDRPLSPIEQAFLYRTHTSLLGRISELEDIIAKNQQQQHIAGSGQHRLRSRGRSGALSPGDSSDISSSSYGRSRHGRFESSISSVSTNTSIDSAAVSSSSTSSSSSSSEPSDELLQLITDLKAERDSLMRDVQMYQERVAELEKTIATLTRRVEAERRESWVAQERMSVLEIERRRAAEEVSRLKDVVRDLDRAKSEEVERVKTELRLEKERISKLEVQVEDVRRELDAEKVKTKQAEDEANMLRNKVEEMSREMDELRTLVVEQQTQILRFQQAQIHAKRAAPKMFNNNNNSFASTSTTSASTGSCSLSFSNSHSHMSSSSTLAVDEIEADDGEGDDDDGAGAGRFKYVPFGMSPPRSHSHASGATLGSVAEAEEEVGGVPRDITADETGDEDDADNNAGDSENELAHYEDTGEFDGDVLEDDDDEEEDEDVVWGEDATTSSFGDFVPRRNALSLNVPTPVPSPAAAPSGSRHGHARVGSMEKGWSFATARVNTVQAQAQDLTRDVPSAEAPKVDRFFDCIEDSEDDESSGAGAGALANLEFPDSKSFWSGMVKRSESSAGEDEDEMDLPPFLLPAGMDADSSATSSGSSLVLDTIAEEEEEEVDEGLSAYLQTPSWKDLITEKLDIVAEEEDEETADEEGDDECLPSPSLRPSFYAQRNSHIQSLLPRPVSLVPPASVLSQMTPNTLKTTLDETVRSPPSTGSKTNRWSIGASLGVNLGLNHSNSTVAITTPVKTRFSLSPSTPVSISNLDNTLLPTPPPTLIPRLASKSGLSISPTSPVSPSPISAGPSPALSSSSSSPVWSEFAERERELGLSTPTPRSPLSRYGPLSPSRIPTPRKSMGSAIATAGSVSVRSSIMFLFLKPTFFMNLCAFFFDTLYRTVSPVTSLTGQSRTLPLTFLTRVKQQQQPQA